MPVLARLAPALLLLAATTAIADDAACSARDAEVQALKARVLELENQLAGRAPPAKSAAKPAAPVTEETVEAGPNRITRKVVVVEEAAYSNTGCSLGLFKGTPPGKWKDRAGWEDLEKGMPAAEVETLLGVEHYNVGTGNRVIWQYGKCGAFVNGEVLLDGGRVESWRTPQF